MEELGKSGIVSFCLLRRGDANNRLARRIMLIQREALRRRYPHIDRKIIDDVCKSDQYDETHVAGTLKNLRKRSWYWVLAVEGGTVQTFAVFYRQRNSVHVLELHTEPKSSGRRPASATLLLGLDYARRTWGVTRVTLSVDQATRRDTHPRRWYERIGLKVVGTKGTYELGDMNVTKYDMAGSMAAICRSLAASVKSIGIEV